MAIPRKVLTRDTASAPSDSTALATSEISVTLGESLTIRGFLQLSGLPGSQRRQRTTHAESHASLFHIGARDIQFNGSNPFQGIDLLGYFNILFDCRAVYIHNQRSVIIPDDRIDLPDEVVYPLFCKPTALSMPEAVSAILG